MSHQYVVTGDFITKAADCFKYYSFDPDNKVAEVAGGAEMKYYCGSTYFDHLVPAVKYAVKADSRDRVIYAYGEAEMAYRLDAITFDQLWKLCEVIHCYLNFDSGKAKQKLMETEW